MSDKLYRALGLMSGTSLDGIDVAFLTTDGAKAVETGPAMTFPYDNDLRDRIRDCLGRKGAATEVEAALTEAHADAVRRFRA